MKASLIWSALVVVVAGCSSSNNGPTGGAVSGAQDNHCIMNDEQVKTPVGACITAGTPIDSGAADDGGANGDAGGAPEFGDPMFNAEADDDDCKYHVKWSSTPVRHNNDVTFTVEATRLFDGMPARMADVTIEAFLTDTHPTPSVNTTTSEPSAGKYTVGPVRFDATGRWTVRFHFYQTCSDVPEDSPHGHAAFFLDVP
jgi:hypothetical protein